MQRAAHHESEAIELDVARRGRRAGRPRSCGRGRRRAAPTSKSSRPSWRRSTATPSGASTSTIRRRACRTCGARRSSRRAARSRGGRRDGLGQRAHRAHRGRAGGGDARRDDLAARLGGARGRGCRGRRAAGRARPRTRASFDERVAGAAASGSTARGGGRPRRRPSSRSLRAELGRGELELETLREEAHRRRSRLASLSEIQDRYESFQKGVRAIMQERQQGGAPGHGIDGLVADIVQPPPELETAVEAVLGERLGNVIVESHEVGVEAIEFLKQKSEGRSSFIPLALRAQRGEVLYDAMGGRRASDRRAVADGGLTPARRSGRGRRRLAETRPACAGRCSTSSATTGSTTRSRPTCSATCWWSRISSARWRSGARRAPRRRSSPSTAR